MLTLSFGETNKTPCALVLGGFDGLHLGHRRLLQEAKKSGLPVAATVMYGGKGKMLFTRAERREIFARAGVFLLYEVDLGGELRRMPAEEFAQTLFSCLCVKEVFCGEDFRFGKDALGTPALLERYAGSVRICKTVKYLAGESGRLRKFSASACKAYLRAGDLPSLNACLCPSGEDVIAGAYRIQGEVEHGREVGRTYGFPTLNLTAPPLKLLPPEGVYGGLCETPECFPAIINIGARPTFGVTESKIEVYLDGFSGDLYGKTVRVYPMEFYRKISAFPSAKALEEQLRRDLNRLRSAHLDRK